jgi:disulfide bond formation protein DsbB
VIEHFMSRRRINGLGALVCAGLMGFALFQQHVIGLEPCPLCVFQRIGVIGLGIIFGIAFLHAPSALGSRIYGLLLLIPGGFGGAVAVRHSWLQSLPADEVPACGPGLDYMLDSFPLSDALKMVFQGSGECAKVVWSFLGISMPGWVLVWMVILTLGGLVANWAIKKP